MRLLRAPGIFGGCGGDEFEEFGIGAAGKGIFASVIVPGDLRPRQNRS
jgi:hypothetical protein